MDDFRSRIEARVLTKTKTPSKYFNEIIFSLVKEGRFSLGDLLDSPIPLVLDLHEELKNYIKAQNKAMKKRK